MLRLVMTMLLIFAGLAPPSRVVAQTKPDEEIVWPLPPDPPRIRYEGILRSERDIGQRGSFLSRLRNNILGERDRISAVTRPWDVLVTPDSKIYVSNGTSSGILVFDPVEKSSEIFMGKGRGVIRKAMGMASDASGHIYVADPSSRRVVVLDAEGEFVRAYGGASLLLNPVDVALSPDETRVYVTDSYMHQVVVFNITGELVHRIGKAEGSLAEKAATKTDASHELSDPSVTAHGTGAPSDIVENRGAEAGSFRYPTFTAVARDGTIYVSDAMNFRIQAFDQDGTFRLEFGGMGDGPGRFARPKGLAVDSKGHVYVADGAFSNIQIFSAEGALLMAFCEGGPAEGQLNMPAGVTIDDQDRILVADRYNDRIQVFQFLHVDEASDTGAGDAGTAR